MPQTPALVNVEALVVADLEQYAELGALVGGTGNDARVATNAPSAAAPPGAVQIFRASGASADPGTESIERTLLQVNAYGPTKSIAWSVMAATFRGVVSSPYREHALGVVTAAVRITGPTDSPDPISGAPRYTASFAITVHPHRTP